MISSRSVTDGISLSVSKSKLVYSSFTFVDNNTHTQVSGYQKDKANLDFTEARDSEWQWHHLSHMQVCISLQTDRGSNHASTTPLFFSGRVPFLTPNQQRQSTEGIIC